MSFDHQAQVGQAAAWAGSATATPQMPTRHGASRQDADQPTQRGSLPLPPHPPKMADLTLGFGGRQARYKQHPLEMLRVWDPAAQRYVTFSHERQYHAFLLLRFRPDVSSLEVSPRTLVYRRSGVVFSAKADLAWHDAADVPHHLFLRREWSTPDRNRHDHFAVTHKVAVDLMSWEQLEQHRVLLDNLEAARQVMTTTAHAGVELTCVAKAIYAHLARCGTCTRGELGAELSCEGCIECAEHLDATLFHLHILGTVSIRWTEQEYGDDTLISRL